MKPTRRTLLTFLGLAPAAAIGSETFREVPDRATDLQCGSNCNDKLIVNALHKLIEGIENKSILVEALEMNAKLTMSDIAKHKLSIDLIYLPEVETS